MNLRAFLDGKGVRYSWSHHDPAYTSQDLAMREHISGKRVAKPVVVEADGKPILCVLPASFYLDLERVREELHAEVARLADERQLATIFPDCELGAEPPIGELYGLPTIADESLTRQDEITFQAGTHEDSVTMSAQEFMQLTEPKIGQIGRIRA